MAGNAQQAHCAIGDDFLLAHNLNKDAYRPAPLGDGTTVWPAPPSTNGFTAKASNSAMQEAQARREGDTPTANILADVGTMSPQTPSHRAVSIGSDPSPRSDPGPPATPAASSLAERHAR